MKLDDPFQRVSRKRTRTYEALRENLRQQGVRDNEAASNVADSMSRTALTLSTILLLAAGGAALVFPNAGAFILVIVILVATWIGATYLQARSHLKRFMLEECQPAPNHDGIDQDANDSGEKP